MPNLYRELPSSPTINVSKRTRMSLPTSTTEPAPGNPTQHDDLPGAAADGRRPRQLLRRVFAKEEMGITVVLIALVVIIGAFHPNFLGHDALLGLIRSASFVALIAFG